MKVIGVIPCRYRSSRFPGKSIVPICGRPLVCHVWDRTKAAKMLGRVIVATDDNRIYDVCRAHAIEAILTSINHPSGTDRVAEVARRVEGDIFVNIQGDEPLLEPASIDAVVAGLMENPGDLVTNAFKAIADTDDVANKNVVKVVTSRAGYALAYSRSAIPYPKDQPAIYKRQVGLYAMCREAITAFPTLPQGYLERSEGVEMYRFLENDYRVRMIHVADRSVAVDVPEDVGRVESIMSGIER